MNTSKKLIGARIKSIREAKKLTQEGLAEKMDINTIYLSNIERGKANPTLDMLIKLSDALEVEMWELFDYGHEVSQRELKNMMKKFTKELDEDKLRLGVKFFRVIAR